MNEFTKGASARPKDFCAVSTEELTRIEGGAEILPGFNLFLAKTLCMWHNWNNQEAGIPTRLKCPE